MRDEIPFLRAILHQPDDNTLRLVYADWLEERGDTRAEYLRLDVECHSTTNSGKDWATLAKQIRELSSKLDHRWMWCLSRVRDLSSGARVDLAFVEDGKGLIEVRGGGEDTVLLVEGRPIALNWPDCAGSVGQCLVFTGHSRGADYARQLANLGERGIDEGRTLADQIGPLLALFTTGPYCLTYLPSADVAVVASLERPGPSNAISELVNYYPSSEFNLVCTQTRESLDEERVAFYRKHIRAGRRPVVLTVAAEGAWCEFVIDGHHKLAAYDRERVRPAVLGIVRWQAPEISLEEGIGFLPARHPGVREYRRLKT
jgi:uncharacterized protein (TIGR02996 family)